MTQLTSPFPTDFDRTTTPVPIAARPGEFDVDLDGGWSSLVGMHGGYMSALAVRAAESLAPRPRRAHDLDELPALRPGGSGRAHCARGAPRPDDVDDGRRARAGRPDPPRHPPDAHDRSTGGGLGRTAAGRPAAAGGLRPVHAAGPRRQLRTVRAAVRPASDAVHRTTGEPRWLRASARGAPARRRLAGDGRRLLPAARRSPGRRRRSAG